MSTKSDESSTARIAFSLGKTYLDVERGKVDVDHLKGAIWVLSCDEQFLDQDQDQILLSVAPHLPDLVSPHTVEKVHEKLEYSKSRSRVVCKGYKEWTKILDAINRALADAGCICLSQNTKAPKSNNELMRAIGQANKNGRRPLQFVGI